MLEDEKLTNKIGPDSCALGPNVVETLDARHLCETHESFSSATIYFPNTNNKAQLLPSIVLVGGWGCGEKAMEAWAPFFASHGIVAMTIGTPSPWKDLPKDRCQALLDASKTLQSETSRAASPLYNRLDVSARAVLGYSLGGGGAQLAALQDPTLSCIIALCPHDGKEMGQKFPPQLSASVPVLIMCSEHDKEADAQKQAWVHYRKTTAPRLIFEIAGGDHFSANGPAGGNETEFQQGVEPFADCNGLLATLCCLFAPFPFGVMNGPTGFAKSEAPKGAIGGVVLAWLQLFLFGDETARLRLIARPDIASAFEFESMDRA